MAKAPPRAGVDGGEKSTARLWRAALLYASPEIATAVEIAKSVYQIKNNQFDKNVPLPAAKVHNLGVSEFTAARVGGASH